MTPLSQAEDLTSLVLRTDFTDNTAWDALKAALIAGDPYPNATLMPTRTTGRRRQVDLPVSCRLDHMGFVDAADESGTFRGFEGD